MNSVPRLDKDGDQGKGTISAKVVAFEVDVEAWDRVFAVWQVVNEGFASMFARAAGRSASFNGFYLLSYK